MKKDVWRITQNFKKYKKSNYELRINFGHPPKRTTTPTQIGGPKKEGGTLSYIEGGWGCNVTEILNRPIV
jgi:hypothetical protein